MAKIDNSLPSKRFLTLTKALPHRHAALLLQLRTGHVALNKFLHKIGRSQSPLCSVCREEDETVMHYLIKCPGRRHLQEQLQTKIGRAAWSISKLLTNEGVAPHLLKYISDMERFKTAAQSLQEQQAGDT